MTSRPLRIGWSIPGTFMRLGLHTGAMIAWVIYRLPIPTLAVGTSVGALILACMISFDRQEMRRARGLVANLKRDQIYKLSHDLIRMGLHLLMAPCVLIAACIAALIIKGSSTQEIVGAGSILVIGIGLFVWLIRFAIRL